LFFVAKRKCRVKECPIRQGEIDEERIVLRTHERIHYWSVNVDNPNIGKAEVEKLKKSSKYINL